jgi:hypothetical protein
VGRLAKGRMNIEQPDLGFHHLVQVEEVLEDIRSQCYHSEARDALLQRAPSPRMAVGHERHRNRGADQVSWTSVNGLVRCSAEDARLAPSH